MQSLGIKHCELAQAEKGDGGMLSSPGGMADGGLSKDRASE